MVEEKKELKSEEQSKIRKESIKPSLREEPLSTTKSVEDDYYRTEAFTK
ncbi:MAG: hypothetical protein QXK21_00430 [Candidatus Micrarchaeia archaeon]